MKRIPAQPQDAFNDYARIVADQQLGMVLELPGHADEERLARGIAALLEHQPVLGCRFVADGRKAWHEPVPDAARAALRIVADLDPWSRALTEAAQSLSAGAGHLCVTLVRGEAGDALGVRIDHTATDGQGAKACVELLAAAYSGTLAPTAAGSEGPDRSWRRLRRSAGWPRLLGAAVKRKDLAPTWGLPGTGGPAGPRRYEMATLAAADTAATRAWGKDRGLTLNDLILAAFYRAMFALLDPAQGVPMVIRVSFDQRRYLDPSDPMPAASNLSSVEPLSLALVADERFQGTVSRAHAQMERLKASSPGLGSALLLETLYRLRGFEGLRASQVAGMERGQSAGRTYPFLSNFGVLDPERLTLGDLAPTRAVVLPVAGHPPFGMLGASSCRGELTLSMGYCEGELHPAIPLAIVAGVAAELRALGAGGPGRAIG